MFENVYDASLLESLRILPHVVAVGGVELPLKAHDSFERSAFHMGAHNFRHAACDAVVEKEFWKHRHFRFAERRRIDKVRKHFSGNRFGVALGGEKFAEV